MHTGRMVHVTFPKVERTKIKSGTCPSCGRKARRSQRFWQTISPFNIDEATGQPRTREQIEAELASEIKVWMTEPTYHAACEP